MSPILRPDFKWIPAATHGTSEAFAARQKQRMAEAEKARKATNVKPLRKAKQ